jgi:hypothetical protein
VTGFETQIPGGDEPRPEAVGEAQIRLADWVVTVLRLFGIRPHPFETEGLAKFCGAIIRRWPFLAKWKAPTK